MRKPKANVKSRGGVHRPSSEDVAEVRAGRGSARDKAEVRAFGGLRAFPKRKKRRKKK